MSRVSLLPENRLQKIGIEREPFLAGFTGEPVHHIRWPIELRLAGVACFLSDSGRLRTRLGTAKPVTVLGRIACPLTRGAEPDLHGSHANTPPVPADCR